MRLNKPRFICLIAGACASALITETAVAAGPPIAFDDYSVTDGTISANCPPPASQCIDGMSDDGMLQRTIVVPSGPNQGTYVQFILTEPGTTGTASGAPFTALRGNLTFTNEDFIKQNHRAGGLSSKQTILEATVTGTDEDRFVNEVVYNYGWAQNASNPWVSTHQEVSRVDYTDSLNPVETFNTTADITIGSGTYDTFGNVVISQAVDLTSGTETGIQKMQYDKKAGFANTTADSVSLPGGTNGGNISWGLFETVVAMWVGQVINTATPYVDTNFGYTRIENKDQGTETSLTSLVDAEAAAWPVPPFSTVPTVASGMSAVSGTDASFYTAPTALAPTVAAGTGSADNTVVSTPLPYDQWTVASGVFTLPACTVDYCGSPIVNSQGLMQRIITVGGIDYVHTIVTEENATGNPAAADFTAGSLAFKNETFVRYNAFIEGIAASLHIAEQDTAYQLQNPQTTVPAYDLPSTAGQFVYNTVVKTGWAHGGPKDPIVEIDQIINVEDQLFLDTSSMYDRFTMKRGETQADTSLDMFSAVGNTGTVASGYNFPIMTQTSTRSGAFQNTAHDGVLDYVLLPNNTGTSKPDNLTWAAGDAISVTWVGGEYVSSTPGSLSRVDSLSYVNLSTGEAISSTRTDGNLGTNMTFDPNPDTWDPVFGTAPTYTDPFVPTL